MTKPVSSSVADARAGRSVIARQHEHGFRARAAGFFSQSSCGPDCPVRRIVSVRVGVRAPAGKRQTPPSPWGLKPGVAEPALVVCDEILRLVVRRERVPSQVAAARLVHAARAQRDRRAGAAESRNHRRSPRSRRSRRSPVASSAAAVDPASTSAAAATPSVRGAHRRFRWPAATPDPAATGAPARSISSGSVGAGAADSAAEATAGAGRVTLAPAARCCEYEKRRSPAARFTARAPRRRRG